MKSKVGAEGKKLKEELEAKSKALRGKVTELEEYRKATEGKIFELQAKVKEFAAKVLPGEKERPGLVTFKSNPLTLLGEEVKVGDKAPNFKVLDNSVQTATLDSYQGKIKVFTTVPSLDTPVCNTETRRFNQEAEKLPENVAILTISMDLPFAQERWCAAAGVEKVKTFSDYRDHSFGLAYGVLVKELKLLARAVFIIDDQDIIRYVELVPEIAQEPDYDRILNAVRALL
ncbi:MAG: thiol peroxidase [Proteobacteria bacterium]|nr:thiol peroxidase [Pseudomonadota bacterium]